MKLIAVAPVNYLTGYGIDACLKIKGLIDLGHDIFIRASNWNVSNYSPVPHVIQERRIFGRQPDQYELVIHPPGWSVTPGKKTIFCTTLESTLISKSRMQLMNKCDCVIVPSRWNEQILASNDIQVPVFRCPESVDEGVFHYRRYPENPQMRIGTAGNVFIKGDKRKGFEKVIAAFQAAFGKASDVRLSIKTTPSCDIKVDDFRIEVISTMLPPEHLSDWYAGLDLFVSASRGEGWGRMPHEAMATGRAVMSCNAGGSRDFIHSGCGYLINCKEVQSTGPYEGAGTWFDADFDHMVESMMVAREHWMSGKLEQLGKSASRRVSKFSQKSCAKTLEKILLDRGAINESAKPSAERSSHIGWTSHMDMVEDFYRGIEETPKMPLPDSVKTKDLTNDPDGIGDILITSTHPKKWAEAGRPNSITHKSRHFRDLFRHIPECRLPSQSSSGSISAGKIQTHYKCGGGHLIQRLQRAFGLPQDEVPKPYITRPESVTQDHQRVAIHLQPGGHAFWQRKYIHPRAREVYPENIRSINRLIRFNKGYHFIEVGTTHNESLLGAEDRTGISLSEAIETIASCGTFIGIMSGPMHIATALGLKCIVIINFPDARQIMLPNIKDVPIVETEWFYPQNIHLHQDNEGPMVKTLSLHSLTSALKGDLTPPNT